MKETFCPFTFSKGMSKLTNQMTAGFLPCAESKCEFYDLINNCCAILSLCECLRRLEYKLKGGIDIEKKTKDKSKTK